MENLGKSYAGFLQLGEQRKENESYSSIAWIAGFTMLNLIVIFTLLVCAVQLSKKVNFSFIEMRKNFERQENWSKRSIKEPSRLNPFRYKSKT